jgi:hypothetical protein
MTRLASDVEAQVKQKLFEANYADSTLKKYRASVARFMSWVDDNKVPYSELDTAAGVDDLACRYISWLFAQSDCDSGKSVASTLLSALGKCKSTSFLSSSCPGATVCKFS